MSYWSGKTIAAATRFAKRRRATFRKSIYRKLRKSNRSKLIIPRSIKNQQVHRFKRYSDGYNQLGAPNTANSFNTYELVFSMADITSQSEFTALYDQYRITAVKVEIMPQGQFITNDRTTSGASSSNSEGTGYWVPPMLYSVIDYNDKNALTSIPEAQEYSTCKLIPYRKTYTKFYFTPCVNMDVAQDASTTARAATKFAPWLMTTSTNVEHYGMKFLIYNPNDNNVPSSYATASWTVRVCYYFECKNVS